MLPLIPGLFALVGLLVVLTLLRDWPRLLCFVAMAGCALPFFLPTSEPLWRSVALVLTHFALIKALQFAAGHVQPRGRIDFFLFMLNPVPVVRWATPRRPDLRRAAFALLTGLGQLGLVWGLMLLVTQLDARNPVQLFTTQIGLYLVVAGICNLSLVKFSLRGLDHDDVFNNPFASLTPGEFWGRRWNTMVSDLLHRYVFLPAGGRRHPVRGMLAAFAVSGAYHELIFDLGTLKFNGGMLAFFMVQGGLVAVTSGSRGFRRLVREVPVLAWLVTTILMLATGILFVYGMDGVDPSNAWRRVFPPA
jgi:hypothetical protein